MSRGAKIGCVVVGVLFVIAALVCGGTALLGRAWFDDLKQSYDQKRPEMESDATAVAAGGPQACVRDGLHRTAVCDPLGITCRAEAKVRTSMCLMRATVPPEFCADVPLRTSIMDVSMWALDQCTQYGYGDDDKCPDLFTGTVAQYCEDHRQK